MTDEQYAINEAVADMSRLIFEHDRRPANSRMAIYLAIEWAQEFHLIHRGTNWIDFEYLDEVEQFFILKMNKYLETVTP
jgi:hypothetical protein